MMSPVADAAWAAASALNGDCDWPLPPPAALFFTYQTRLARLSVTVPFALVGVGVPPLLLLIVYVNVSTAMDVSGGV